jgi:hypothetical protein
VADVLRSDHYLLYETNSWAFAPPPSPAFFLRKPGERLLVPDDPISVAENYEFPMRIQGYSWEPLTEVQRNPFFHLQSTTPFPESSTQSRFRVALTQQTTIECKNRNTLRPRERTSPRNDICIKYCYALREVDGTERTEHGCTTYFEIYWRTYQITDHSPIWIRMKTDCGEDFHKQKATIGS